MAYDQNARHRERYATDPEYREKRKARQRERYAEHRERINARHRERRADPEHREKRNAAERERQRELRATDPEYREKRNAQQRELRADPDYRERINARRREHGHPYAALRRAAKLQRTPAWLTDKHRKEIAAIYKRAAQITARTGIAHHVDHILPLQGKNISGLHVPSNLQILTETENKSKGNTYHE